MPPPTLTLSVLPDSYAISRLDPDAPVPDWVRDTPFCSLTRTPEELSIVCPDPDVPADTQADRGWRIIQVRGPLDLTQVGVLASLAKPLADAGISVFAVSTYDTDYLLVKGDALERTLVVLSARGHNVG